MKFIYAIVCISVASLAMAEDSEEGGKIVGGTSTTIEQNPYQVSLEYLGSHICGGVYIGKSRVLTAAHCTAGQNPSMLTVRAGSTTVGSGGVVVSVQRIAQHPTYNSSNMNNDVSVLILETDLPNSDRIKPILLNNETLAVGTKLTATGWGTLSEGGQLSTTLQTVDVPLVSAAVCKAAYIGTPITDSMICAGYKEGGKDACQGDSGGPLALKGQFVLVGISSLGQGCARVNKYGVYTNVSKFVSFINSVQ